MIFRKKESLKEGQPIKKRSNHFTGRPLVCKNDHNSGKCLFNRRQCYLPLRIQTIFYFSSSREGVEEPPAVPLSPPFEIYFMLRVVDASVYHS